LAALLSIFILETNDCHHVAVSPVVDRDGSTKFLAALISEAVGTFIFVFLFMLSTDSKTQFSTDKVINCFIIASSYCAARLMAGGTLVTGIN
jgi:glycerol uptake facilitator-like aquaporin